MAKRTTPPLSFGEYVQSHPERSDGCAGTTGTDEGLHARLAGILGRTSRSGVSGIRKACERESRLVRRRLDPYPQEPTPEHEEVCNLLHLWARRFEAEADWLLGEALQTLRVWSSCPELRRSLEWMSVPVIRKLRIGDRFDFTFEAWDPQTVKWAGFSRALRCRLKEALRTYEKDTRRKAESWGLVRARGRYSPYNLEWFVLYQFGHMSSSKIADRYVAEKGLSCDDSTVLKGIKAAAKLIGWDHLRQRQTENRKTR